MIPLWQQLREDPLATASSLLDMFAIEEPPVPIIGIAKGLGVEVYYRPNAGWEGALSIDEEGDAHIIIEGIRDVQWQRFVAAHELGHLVLHPKIKVHRDTRKSLLSKERVEREATEFAARILMPKWMVEFAVDYMTTDIDHLSRLFNVSPLAIRNRLHDLGILRMY